MINTPLIIYNDLKLNPNFKSESFLYSFTIDKARDLNTTSLKEIHYNPFFLTGGGRFCVFLKNGKDDLISPNYYNEKKEFLLQYFFHPNYILINNKPVICFNAIEANLSESIQFVKELEKYLISQGYDGIELLYFSDEIQTSENNICFNEKDEISVVTAVYSKLLQKNYYCAKYIGIPYSRATEFTQCIEEIENNLLKENPNHYSFLVEHKNLKQLNSKLNRKLTLTERDLENQKEYLKIIKDQDETLRIKNFYNSEYEILPLWYKRLGHIIKVITGKRTFRSLFDNNVKKYKD